MYVSYTREIVWREREYLEKANILFQQCENIYIIALGCLPLLMYCAGVRGWGRGQGSEGLEKSQGVKGQDWVGERRV